MASIKNKDDNFLVHICALFSLLYAESSLAGEPTVDISFCYLAVEVLPNLKVVMLKKPANDTHVVEDGF